VIGLDTAAVLAGRFLGAMIGEAAKIAAPVVIPLILSELQKGNTGEVGKANEAANAMLPGVSAGVSAGATDGGLRVQQGTGETQHDSPGRSGVYRAAGGSGGRVAPEQRW